ncbi:unnamed protein product [marine sediment metagenome]|uniref:Bacterial Ig-like domain-containing protein n=1 Tax=marine sediment metagenome TaxID=412755 RepID=X1TYV4_9ZZZZ
MVARETIEFVGRLQLYSAPVLDAEIEIYWIEGEQVVDTVTTNTLGDFTAYYTPTTAGTYKFQAQYNAP